MTDFAIRPEDLQDTLAAALGDRVQNISIALGEVTVHVNAQHYLSVMQTLRDAPGRFVDAPLDPLYHYDDVRVRNSLFVVNAVNKRARLLPATDLVERVALDQYAFVRDAYLKRRASLIRDGAPDPTEQVYEDFEEESSSMAPQPFPPFKAALVQPGPVDQQADAVIPADLQQSERARSGLGLVN